MDWEEEKGGGRDGKDVDSEEKGGGREGKGRMCWEERHILPKGPPCVGDETKHCKV